MEHTQGGRQAICRFYRGKAEVITYTQILYQIVFSTKDREQTLTKNRDTLYKHIWSILNNKKCHLYQIGGVEDHIHIQAHCGCLFRRIVNQRSRGILQCQNQGI